MHRNHSFREMMEEMDRLFDTFDTIDTQNNTIPIDIEDQDDRIIVHADLPGTTKDQISLQLRDQTLTIRAEKETAVREENEAYLKQERQRQSLQRSVPLPVPVDAGSADASYENGVLTIEIDKQDSGGTEISID